VEKSAEPPVLEDLEARLEAVPTSPPVLLGRSLGHWVLVLAGVLTLLGLVGMGLFLQPDGRGYGTHEKLGLPACGLMEWTGVPCPGCGVTTSATLASHGRLTEALATQPFGLIVVAGAVVYLAWLLVGLLAGRDLHVELQRLRLRPWAIGLSVLLGASWIYKLIAVLG
jgi:hypothetical protein